MFYLNEIRTDGNFNSFLKRCTPRFFRLKSLHGTPLKFTIILNAFKESYLKSTSVKQTTFQTPFLGGLAILEIVFLT